MKQFGIAFVLSLCLSAALPGTENAVGQAAPQMKTTWGEIQELVQKEKNSEAFQLALEHKDENDMDILCFLGFCYADGIGCEIDDAQAVTYFRRVEDSRPIAKYLLGVFYALGRGLDRDVEMAWTLISEAMERGYKISENTQWELMNLLITNQTEFTDPNLDFHFPGEKFHLQFIQRYLPKRRLGYSLRYGGEGDEKLDLYVYNRTQNPISNGISEAVEKELQDAVASVSEMERRGIYQNVRALSQIHRGKLKASGIQYLWFSFYYDMGENKGMQSVTLAFGALGQVFKIRYTGNPSNGDIPGAGENAKPNLKREKEAVSPKIVGNILQGLDTELARKLEDDAE